MTGGVELEGKTAAMDIESPPRSMTKKPMEINSEPNSKRRRRYEYRNTWGETICT